MGHLTARWVGALPTALAVVMAVGVAWESNAQSPAVGGLAPRSGGQVYAATCASCHLPSGEGNNELYPPLTDSEFVLGPETRLVAIILHGLSGPIEVNGQPFSGLMPPWGAHLSDEEIANVATYVRSTWGNRAAAVTASTVRTVRAASKARTSPLSASDLAGFVRQ